MWTMSERSCSLPKCILMCPLTSFLGQKHLWHLWHRKWLCFRTGLWYGHVQGNECWSCTEKERTKEHKKALYLWSPRRTCWRCLETAIEPLKDRFETPVKWVPDLECFSISKKWKIRKCAKSTTSAGYYTLEMKGRLMEKCSLCRSKTHQACLLITWLLLISSLLSTKNIWKSQEFPALCLWMWR